MRNRDLIEKLQEFDLEEEVFIRNYNGNYPSDDFDIFRIKKRRDRIMIFGETQEY